MLRTAAGLVRRTLDTRVRRTTDLPDHDARLPTAPPFDTHRAAPDGTISGMKDADEHLRSWLLTSDERDNEYTRVDSRHPGDQAWSTGNHARPLVHGATYFAELYERIQATEPGDLILFTDWRGDASEQLTDDPESTVHKVLAAADLRGVDVRGLIWRSHWQGIHFSAEQNRHMAKLLQKADAEVLLDMRVRALGSHHQKFVVIRHKNDPSRDIAFVGGIDLCHSRRDDAQHRGDPQPYGMSEVYGPHPPWHDVQVALTGPIVYDVETVFRERWEDPNPVTRNPGYRIKDRLRGIDLSPAPLPAQAPPPPPVPGGTHTVQLLRTYPRLSFGRGHAFAPDGERSVARGYSKAIRRAKELIYIEDQYFWSVDVAEIFVERLRENPDLHVVAVVPHSPDQTRAISRVPQLLGRYLAMHRLMSVAPDRVAVYSIENHEGTPVYVHAKVCVIDDQWAVIGSDNFNRRSWTHDSELSAVIMDGDGTAPSPYARRLRLTLAAEHLDRDLGSDTFPGDIGSLETSRDPRDLDDSLLLDVMGDCVEPEGMLRAFADSAAALDKWHDEGQVGQRPPGRLRLLDVPRFNLLTRTLWQPLYRTLVDPDGRPHPMRHRHRF